MDTISDNAANAGIVVGDIKTNPFDIDMRWVGSILYRNVSCQEVLRAQSRQAPGIILRPILGLLVLLN